MSTKSVLNEKLKQEQRRKEDRAFYTMVLALAIGAVLEFALIALYRRYSVGANYRPVLRIIMWTLLAVTATSGIAFIVAAVKKKFKYLPYLLAVGGLSFLIAVILRLTNTLGIIALKVSCTACPVILLLFIIFLIYQTEFFMAAMFGSLGVFTIWVTKKVFYIRYYKRLYVMIGVIALLVLLAAVTYIAMKNKGYIGKGDWKLRLFSPKTSYKALYITYGITLALLLIYRIFEIYMFYPVIIAFAAYVFVSAIYYTIKLI